MMTEQQAIRLFGRDDLLQLGVSDVVSFHRRHAQAQHTGMGRSLD